MAERSTSKSALSLRLGLFAVGLALVGWLGAFLGWLPSYTAFRLFALGTVVGGLATLMVGLMTWVRSRRSGQTPRGNTFGLAIGSLLLLGVISLVAPHADAPPIHDLTTDLEDPPRFVEIADLEANQGRDLTYPHGGEKVPNLQRQEYPDLQPIRVSLPPSEAFAASLRAVEDLGWTIVRADAPEGIIEAFDTSAMFRFIDDVVIRVQPGAEGAVGAVVDVRSTSRVGISDLGANARRIRLFEERLLHAIAEG